MKKNYEGPGYNLKAGFVVNVSHKKADDLISDGYASRIKTKTGKKDEGRETR